MEGKMSLTACRVLNEMRFEGKLCDTVITVDDVAFNAHKIILATCSEYFRALFTGGLVQSEKRIYSIPGVSANIMHLLMEYAYTRSITVTMENAEDLLVAADYLCILDVTQVCCDFLQNHLCPENCIGIWRIAELYSCPALRCKAYFYMLQHFEAIAHYSEEFLELTLSQLAAVIDEDKVNVTQETVVFDAVLRWINHCLQERSDHIAILLPKIRLGFITAGYLKNKLKNNKLVLDCIGSKSTVNDALMTINNIVSNGPYLGFSRPLTLPRFPPSIILALGGWETSFPNESMDAYDARADRWINVTKFEEGPKAQYGVAFLYGFVYCIGSSEFKYEIEYDLMYVQRFDLVTHTWHQVAPMHKKRFYVSVTVLDGCIYAMGGTDRHHQHNTAECYEPDTNQWTLIAPMHVKRSNANATTLHGRVYICSGFTLDEYLKSAECYNPATDQWTLIESMNSRRSDLGVVAYGDHVYAVGGSDGIHILCTAEVYNPVTNTWRAVAPMLQSRCNFDLEVVENRLFVIGGLGYNGYSLCQVECYDEKTDQWSAAESMERVSHGRSCCVVYDLPNMVEYTAPRDDIRPHPPPLPTLTLSTLTSVLHLSTKLI